ncbi:MAG: L-aspartate oxidase [Magnetococcus sp. WYHC-3]
MPVESRDARLQVTDFLIVGSGAAGLDLALRLADHGSVTLLTKSHPGESNSLYAQGGIAAVLDPRDHPDAHISDTLVAGCDLNDARAVRFVVENGPAAIQRLADLGVVFTREDGRPHLTREGGHSARRVVHAADATGRAIVETMLAKVRAHPAVRLLDHQMVVDLITTHKLGHYVPGRRNRCLGCHVLDTRSGRVNTIQARFTILATGGAGKVYLYTSNPDTATGDGIAMAYRAGCRVAGMEFIQFHPTCLYHPHAKSFLISEAVRGEGGRLLLKDGQPFMHRHHPRGELAPRDIVARAIDFELKRTGDDCVFLDIRHKGAEFIIEHFPNIHAKCATLGLDITREPIPVVPAAHYTCGGVITDLQGETDLLHLYAIGECAHTGLHGANRLASNSLLECIVFADAASRSILEHLRNDPALPTPQLPLWDSFDSDNCGEAVLVSHDWDEIRRFMWNYVGIVRTNRRLVRARRRVEMLRREIDEYYWNCGITQDLLELRNIALVAFLIIRAAMARKESRGLHFNADYPQRDDEHWLRDTVLPLPEEWQS